MNIELTDIITIVGTMGGIEGVNARPARPSVCASAPTRSTSWRVQRGEAA